MKISRIILMTVAAAGMLAACGESDENNIVPDQREAIIKFLDTNELAYEEVGGVFRHFPDPRTSEPDAHVIRQGDEVGIKFELYKAAYTKQANSLAPLPTTALYSNKEFVQEALISTGLNPQYWPSPSEPFKAKVGADELIAGLDRGLAGCQEGDSVLLFITSNLAFGTKPIANLSENTAILYIVNIESVNNQ